MAPCWPGRSPKPSPRRPASAFKLRKARSFRSKLWVMPDDDLIIKPPEPPPDPTPVCPYCLTDPATLTVRGPIKVGNVAALVIYCGNAACRKVWNVDVIGRTDRVQQVPRFMPPLH